MRLLIAEDEADLRSVIEKRLTNEGYSVDACRNGDEAWDYLCAIQSCGESENEGYDAIILDIMMPKMSGLEVLSKMRTSKISTPVLLLTARDSIEDRVKGLDTGADDYLIKPFAFDELLARIRVMTRKPTQNPTNIYTCGDLTLNANTRTVTRSNTEIPLSSREFAILEYLIRNQNTVLSRERIERHTRTFDESESGVGSNITDVYIRYLRKKIDDPYDQKLIQTVRGIGYTLKNTGG